MKIVQANEAAARMMQIEAESLINRSVLDFYIPCLRKN